jgi:hypothetical protein
MWKRIIERLFPRLRPALKAPEQLAPDHPKFVFVAVTQDGSVPYSQSADGEYWVTVATDAQKFAGQVGTLLNLGFTVTSQFILFEQLHQIVADGMPEIRGIVIAEREGIPNNLVYTR